MLRTGVTLAGEVGRGVSVGRTANTTLLCAVLEVRKSC